MTHVVVTASEWQVVIDEPGEDPIRTGGTFCSLESAIFFRDNCLEPRRGKRDGFTKKAKVRIYRINTIRTEEPV